MPYKQDETRSLDWGVVSCNNTMSWHIKRSTSLCNEGQLDSGMKGEYWRNTKAKISSFLCPFNCENFICIRQRLSCIFSHKRRKNTKRELFHSLGWKPYTNSCHSLRLFCVLTQKENTDIPPARQKALLLASYIRTNKWLKITTVEIRSTRGSV